MKRTLIALAGVIAATAAIAQPAPPTPGASPPSGARMAQGGPDGDAPPSPPHGGPGGPRGDRQMPPPPRGPAFHLAHGTDGGVRLGVECAERDATRDCADVASQLLDKLNAVAKAK